MHTLLKSMYIDISLVFPWHIRKCSHLYGQHVVFPLLHLPAVEQGWLLFPPIQSTIPHSTN